MSSASAIFQQRQRLKHGSVNFFANDNGNRRRSEKTILLHIPTRTIEKRMRACLGRTTLAYNNSVRHL
jgi:hypothetical protein